jgi:hypothetical protein
MEPIRVSKRVYRIWQLSPDPSNGSGSTLLYKKKRKRKKGSKMLAGVEKAVRRSASATKAGAGKYLTLHKRANRKRRDGWLRDFSGGLGRAMNAAGRKLRFKMR